MEAGRGNTLFKIIGVLHLLNGLFFGFILMLVFMSKLISDYSVDQAQTYGYDISGLETGGTLVFSLIILALTLLYLSSAFGFFKMKKWQPVVFLILVVFGFMELLYRIYDTGFQASYILTVLFMVLWLIILSYVWKNKQLFKN